MRMDSTSVRTNSPALILALLLSYRNAHPAGDGHDREKDAQLPTAHGGRAGRAHTAIERSHVASAPLRAVGVVYMSSVGPPTRAQRYPISHQHNPPRTP